MSCVVSLTLSCPMDRRLVGDGGTWKLMLFFSLVCGRIVAQDLPNGNPVPLFWLWRRQLDAEDDLWEVQLFCCFSALPRQRRHFISKHWGDTLPQANEELLWPIFGKKEQRPGIPLLSLSALRRTPTVTAECLSQLPDLDLWLMESIRCPCSSSQSRVAQGMWLLSAC